MFEEIFSLAILGVVVITTVLLAVKRYYDSKKEDFEDRES